MTTFMKKKIISIPLGKGLLSLLLCIGLLLFFSIILQAIFPSATEFATPFAFIIGSFLMFHFFKIQNQEKSITIGRASRTFVNGTVIGIWIPCFCVLLLLLFDFVDLTITYESINDYFKITLLFLSVAIGEEYYFRGYIYDLFKQNSTNVAIIGNSLFFAIIHLINPASFSKPISFIIIEMANIFLLAVLFSITRYYTRSVWMAIGMHFTMNMIQSAIFGFANGGKQVASVTTITPITNSVWNGSHFGLESSLMLTLVTVLFIALVKFHYTANQKKEFLY